MKWFMNRGLTCKLMAGFILISLPILLVGLYAQNGTNKVAERGEAVRTEAFRPTMLAGNVRAQALYSRIYAYRLLSATEPEAVAKATAQVRQQLREMNDSRKLFDAANNDPDAVAAFARHKEHAQRWEQTVEEKLIPKVASKKNEDARKDMSESSANFDLAIRDMFDAVDACNKLAEVKLADAKAVATTTGNWVIGISVAGVAFAAILGFCLARLIRGPLLKTMTVLEAVAKGDLSQRVDVSSTDEVGRMAQALNIAVEATYKSRTENEEIQEKIKVNAARETQEAEELRKKVDVILTTVNGLADGDFSKEIPNLGNDAVGQMAKALNKAVVSVRTTLQDVRNVASTVSSAAQELSSASEEIASGAQEQASSLEETAASLEEITATIKQNTDSAQQARQLAGSSKEVAEKGGQVVGSAVEAMAAINQSSKKIADIITAIDEIAFQTNLLALNAAVEAARAGEQGRGFAVVASEVRNLAQRSATAAKEIKSLIQDSVKKVDNGTDLVNRSGVTLNEIVTSVKRVTDIVTEIAAASREQTTGVDQVNKAVAQMDKVTQTNAGQTEELSSTSQTLLGHADQLQALVSKFRLGAEMTSAPSAASRPAKIAEPKNRTTGRSKPRELVLSKRSSTNGNGKVHDLDSLDHEEGSDGFKEF